MSKKIVGVIICSVTQNIAFGTMFGSFGPLLPQTMARFGISLVTATFAMSLATLAIAIGAPLGGVIVQRLSAPVAMTFAAVLSACCYVVMGVATTFLPVLISYTILGICAVILGIIGPITLVNQWFPTGRGKMLGLIHMPVLLVLVPIIVAELLPSLGRAAVLFVIAALFLIIAPFFRYLARIPIALIPDERQQPVNGGPVQSSSYGPRRLLALTLISVAVATVSGGSVAYMAHIVPFGLSGGLALTSASLLISLYSGFGVLGSPIAGWTADRIGPSLTAASAACFVGLLWLALPRADGILVFVIASMLGFFAAPINTMHAALLSAIYAPMEVGKAMGISYIIKLPILFALAPLVAIIFDRFGSYREAFTVLAVLTLAAAIVHVIALIIVRDFANTKPLTD